MEAISGLQIRQMTLDNLESLVFWANTEGWFYSKNDVEPFYKLDPNGFFLLEVNGKPAGGIGAPKYGDYAFIDLFIIKDEYRGKGYGILLLDHALAYLKDCKSIGLDSTFDMLDYWQKQGFKKYHDTLFFGRRAQGTLNKDLIDLKAIDCLDTLVEYDTSVFGYPRRDFLECLLKRKDTFALGAMKDGKITGFGIIRKHHGGQDYFIGPISADTPELAKQILEGLQCFANRTSVYTTVFDCNKDAMNIINEDEGWNKTAHENRMYKGEMPKMDVSRIYSPVEEFS